MTTIAVADPPRGKIFIAAVDIDVVLVLDVDVVDGGVILFCFIVVVLAIFASYCMMLQFFFVIWTSSSSSSDAKRQPQKEEENFFRPNRPRKKKGYGSTKQRILNYVVDRKENCTELKEVYYKSILH